MKHSTSPRRLALALLPAALVLAFMLILTPPASAVRISPSPHDVAFVTVLYDYPSAGQSTWYYNIQSNLYGTGGQENAAISHMVFDLSLVGEAGGCQTVVDEGIWKAPPGPGGVTATGAGDPSTGLDNGGTDIYGLKFNQGFNEGESRGYYFTLDGNYNMGEIQVGIKYGTNVAFGIVPGPVADCTENVNLDWGDDPNANYQTQAASTGAMHVIEGPYLGACVDAEQDGQANTDANGDDLVAGGPGLGTCGPGGDEDGVETVGNWMQGIGEITVDVTAGPACLNVWLDFTDGATLMPSGDGDFFDTYSDGVTSYPEHVIQNQLLASGTDIPQSFDLPDGWASDVQWYLRARLTPTDANGACGVGEAYNEGISPNGLAQGGEVEDYLVRIGPTAITLKGFDATPATLPAGMIALVTVLLGLGVFAGFTLHKQRGQA